MAPHPLVEVDPAALAITYLAGHPDVQAALALWHPALGADGLIAGVNRPPYPRVTVSDPPSGGTNLTWLVTPSLQVDVLGDLDGTPGKAALRQLAMVVVGALWQWPQMAFWPDDPVVTDVRVPLPGWLPLPTGQPRYVSVLALSIHPPTLPLTRTAA